MICLIWKAEVIPEQWKKDLYVLATRKGINSSSAVNRGKTLLNVGYKIFSNILYEQLQGYVENILGYYHCGF